MYIEYTPLEDHLQTILKNPTTAAALLAHVEAEEAEEVQAGAVENNEAYRNAAPGATVGRQTNFVPNHAGFAIKPPRRRNEEEHVRGRIAETVKLSEEENDEEYELFDVVETGEDDQEAPQKQLPGHNQSGLIEYEYVVTNGDQSFDLPNNPEKVVIEVEDTNFGFVVSHPPESENSQRIHRAQNSRFLHEHSTKSSHLIRPLPALRPIAPPVQKLAPYALQQKRVSAGPKLLNGNLHNFCYHSEDSDCSSQSSFTYVPRTKRFVLTAEAEHNEDFDYIENTNSFPVHNTPNGEVPDSPMGIDIWNRFCKFLKLNSDDQHDDCNEGTRKRRCDDWSANSVGPHQIKYRKVDNHFPKFINGPLEDDAIDSFPYPKKPRKPLHLQQNHHLDNCPSAAMSQRRSISHDKAKQRRSIFAPPETIHRLVRNTTYADFEFSDDDEPELLNGFNLPDKYNNKPKKAMLCSIPVSCCEEDGSMKISTGVKNPPPPLIDANTGSILASSLRSDIGGQPTYSQALRQNLTDQVFRRSGKPPPKLTTSKSYDDFPRPFSTLVDAMQSSTWRSGTRSILQEEEESQGREQYQNLLKKLVPFIYGKDENASPATVKAKSDSRRRSSLLAAAAATAAGKEWPPLHTGHPMQMPKGLPRPRASLPQNKAPSEWPALALPRQKVALTRQHDALPKPRLSAQQQVGKSQQIELTPQQISLLKEEHTSTAPNPKTEALHPTPELSQRKAEYEQRKEEILKRKEKVLQRERALLREEMVQLGGHAVSHPPASSSLPRKIGSRLWQMISPPRRKPLHTHDLDTKDDFAMLRSSDHEVFRLPAAPLSSTANLIESSDDEPKIVSVNEFDPTSFYRAVAPQQQGHVINIDDTDISDIIDLDDEDIFHKMYATKSIDLSDDDEEADINSPIVVEDDLPYVDPVNSLQEQLSAAPHLKEGYFENREKQWIEKRKENKAEALKIEKEAKELTKDRRAAEIELQERFKKFQFFPSDLVIIDEFPEPIETSKEPEYVELTAEHRDRIKSVMSGPSDQVLITKFNLNITRRDIYTLLGHNWLNDEVINFYMNLLTERGEKRSSSDGLPTVYAMNTFFIPRLMQAGHSGVKRWTRKVDIFARDVIPVPVHVGGVHWCMAIIHLKNRTIKYYDSMGTPNPSVLKVLEQYLKDESLDKRKQPFDTSQFQIESVSDVPKQLNGSDCGVFSCMFAEHITRNKEITFTQQQMEYFRQKMMVEILQGELLQ